MGKNCYDKKMDKEKDFRDYEYIPNPYFHPEKKDDCCCSDDMYKLLKSMKNNTDLRPGLSNAKFAFIGKNLLFGTNLELYSDWSTLGNDNINTPSSNFIGFDNCSCGYINVSSGSLTYPTPVDTTVGPAEQEINLPVDQISLCNLNAIVFDYNASADNFVDDLQKMLQFDTNDCEISYCEDCCCNSAIINKINAYASPVNIVAGWLALYQVDYLGRFKNVAVFINTSSASPTRIYLVCLDSITYFGPRAI